MSGPRGSFEIVESADPIDGLTTVLGRVAPPTPPGFLTVGPFGWSYLHRDGLYIRISAAMLGSEMSDAVLTVARQLVAVP